MDCGTDVLSRIDRRRFDPRATAARIPENARAAGTPLRRVSLRDDRSDPFIDEAVARAAEVFAFANQERPPRHPVQGKPALLPAGQHRMGRLHDCRGTRSGRGRRPDGSVPTYPHERVEDEAIRSATSPRPREARRPAVAPLSFRPSACLTPVHDPPIGPGPISGLSLYGSRNRAQNRST